MKLPALDPRRWLSSRLARGTLAATLWQGVRVGAQALWMVVIARAIGPSGYGTFAGAAGLAGAIGSLTGVGFGLLMLQDVSRRPDIFPAAWKRANIAFLASGGLLWAIFVLGALPLLPSGTPAWQYAAIGLPEIMFFPQTILASYAFQTRERMGMAGWMYALVPMGNLVAAACFLWLSNEQTLGAYVPWHVASSLGAALAGHVAVSRILRPGPARFLVTRRDVGESLGYSMMRVIDTALVSIDKTLVLRLADPASAGWYTAAFRLASVLAIPVSALAMAALPRLFRARGGDQSARMARTLLLSSLIGGGAASAGMIAASWALPLLLGDDFARSAQAARYLCLTPFLIGLCSTGANVLVTSDRRRLRMMAQAAGLAVLAVLGFTLIPPFGIAGAAVMLQGALGTTAALLWWAAFRSRSPTHSTSRNHD